MRVLSIDLHRQALDKGTRCTETRRANETSCLDVLRHKRRQHEDIIAVHVSKFAASVPKVYFVE